MQFENVLYDAQGGVARVTLNRPDAANSIDVGLAKDLAYAAMECDEDPAVRAVLITGLGKMFCAGGDLRSFASAGDRVPLLLKEITTYLHAAISRFARMRAPVIAAVNGPAAGAGFSLVAAVDLAVAAESASFTMAYTAAGLVPDGSSTFFLPRSIGRRRALELMLLNRRLSAAEALEWGIVNRVVPDADLESEATKLAETIAAGPTGAYGLTKRLLQSTSETLEAQMELETRAIADVARTEDARGAIRAFLEKRKPTFTGR